MGLIRRLFGIVFGTAGLIGLSLCVAGTVGCWLAHSALRERVDRAFGKADASIAQARESLGHARNQLVETKSELAAIRKSEAEMKSQPRADRNARRSVSKKSADSFDLQLLKVRKMLVQASEVSLVANGLLDALAELQLTERVQIDVDRLRAASYQLNELNNQTTKLATLLAKAAPDDGGEIEGESTQAGEVLDRILAAVDEGSTRLDSAKESVGRGSSRVNLWIDRLAIAITILLGWIGAGQLSLLLHGRKLTFARGRSADAIPQQTGVPR